jgi:hypothetical protein
MIVKILQVIIHDFLAKERKVESLKF